MKAMPDPRERPWLTVTEVAELTGEGEKAIRAAVAAGQLPVLHVGRYIRIPTARLAQVCGITPDNTEAGPSQDPATALDSPAPTGARHDDDDPPHPVASNVHPIRG